MILISLIFDFYECVICHSTNELLVELQLELFVHNEVEAFSVK
jgi:hypothetical protein